MLFTLVSNSYNEFYSASKHHEVPLYQINVHKQAAGNILYCTKR